MTRWRSTAVSHRRHAVSVDDAGDASRADGVAAIGERGEGGGQFERRDEPGAKRQRRDVGQVAHADIGRETQDVARPHALLQRARGAVVRLQQGGADRQFVRRLAAGVPRRPFLRPLWSDVRQTVEHRQRGVAVLERRSIKKRLERRSRLPPAACGAVELRLAGSRVRRRARGCRRFQGRSLPAPLAAAAGRTGGGLPTPPVPRRPGDPA